MFAKIADRITRKLEENNTIDHDNFEICRYGLQQGLNIILNIMSTLIIGALFGMLWEVILFSVLYIPLRSNAGGYHANTASRCYFYSVLLIIAVLLAMKCIVFKFFICIILIVISCSIILFAAPVSDVNKPLESIETVVYKKRSIVIFGIETIMYFCAKLLDIHIFTSCIIWNFIVISIVLIVGLFKRRLNVHFKEDNYDYD